MKLIRLTSTNTSKSIIPTRPIIGICITLLILSMILTLSVSAKETDVNTKRGKIVGQININEIDSINLPKVSDGKQLILKVIPLQIRGNFDVFVFTQKQLYNYITHQTIKAQGGFTNVEQVVERVELDSGKYTIVIDNSNATVIGAKATSSISYQIQYSIEDQPILKRYGLLIGIIGGVLLIILIALGIGLSTSGKSYSSKMNEQKKISKQPKQSAPRIPDLAPQPPSLSTKSNQEKAYRKSTQKPKSTTRTIQVQCPGCSVKIDHNPTNDTITCPSCGLSGKMG